MKKIKELVKLSLGKIILTVILFFISILQQIFSMGGGGLGFPLIYLTIPSEPPLGNTFYLLYLIIDIIFWYIISCLIMLSYNKLRSK